MALIRISENYSANKNQFYKNKIKKMKTTICTFIFLMCISASSFGQLKEKDNLLGGTLGFWAENKSSTFGFNYENQITQAGAGSIGLGALLRYSNYSQNGNEKFSNVFIGGQTNYNFNQIGNGKFVPFIGLVLGFYSSSPDGNSVEQSGLWTWAQAGSRYFFSPNIAGVARFGIGNFKYNTLDIGMDFKF